MQLVFSFSSPNIIRRTKMKNFITASFVIITVYLMSICQMNYILAASTNGNIERPRNKARISRYHARAPQYARMKPEPFINDFGDDDDIFDLSKRQQSNSDDYGHLRFGKRDEQFDDYGHIMRFGRNGGEKNND